MTHELWHRDGATDADTLAWMIRTHHNGEIITTDLGNYTEAAARAAFEARVARAHVPSRERP